MFPKLMKIKLNKKHLTMEQNWTVYQYHSYTKNINYIFYLTRSLITMLCKMYLKKTLGQ